MSGYRLVRATSIACLTLLGSGCLKPNLDYRDAGAVDAWDPPERPYDGCRAYYEALYARFEQCGAGVYTFLLEDYLRYQCIRVQQRVDGGTLRYDRDKLPACLQGVRDSACTAGALQHLSQLDTCGVFVGLRADGAGCLDSFECASGTCDAWAACPGTCRVYADLGQSCATRSCKPGLSCDQMMMTCATPPAADQACSQGRCGLGLYCDGGTCHEPKLSGPCLQSVECGLGARCVGAVPPDTFGQCIAYKRLKEPCTDDKECIGGLQCGDGLCNTYPRAGGRCGTVAGHSKVLSCLDSYCDASPGMDGSCQGHIAEGQPCDMTRSDQCVPDTSCVTSHCTRTACFSYR